MKWKHSRQNGFALAESAAALTLMLPLTIAIMFVVVEAAQAFLIKEALAQGARSAARNLAIAYGQDPSVSSNRAAQNSQVFDKIRIYNIINASEQFADPVFDTSYEPSSVSVTVAYVGEKYGLPKFPNPDPLHLGSGYHVSATSTYRLE